ncbi:Type IV fimbrial assembly, ATPase PilB [hydrothermal vent metagenome]|uniref:Type IV fimbrial assembly, ATPase PilB n=1 Tax=hydrothermal vent metagenome TaxID=652676 RepID=A0A3B1DFT3_9ZZZZ
MKKFDKILHDGVIGNNLLSGNELQTYVAAAQVTNMPLQEYFVKNEILTEKQILIVFSQSLKLPLIDFNKITIAQEVVDKVPIKFAGYYHCMPVKLEGAVLVIAAAVPLDLRTQDEIRTHLGFRIKVALAEKIQIDEALKKYYGLASDTIDRLMSNDTINTEIIDDPSQWVEDLEQRAEDPTVSNLVNEIILEAYRQRATDIHIEPYRNKVRFRYRIDGVLVDANLPPKVKHFLPQILSRIKILANLSITEKRLPQDGSAVVKTREQQLDLRISTMPTPRGESMVIRILPTKIMLFSLSKLGFDKKGVEDFRDLIKKPHGIIFMTGPTGSGKTTSLYACLNEINSAQRKIITIEDPVEYEMSGITQVQVNTKVNFDFSRGLRSILRHDPDILMVGEVRDLETAEVSIRTALTGHLVFSTLHTNDAASGVTRLIDMGVEPYLVASSVEAFVAQRLVRVICPKCKEENKDVSLVVKEEIQRSLSLPSIEEIKIYHGKGCDFCHNTGFYGRKAIYEILRITDAIRVAILEKPRSDYIKRIALQEGIMTLRQNGWKSVLAGETTPDEIVNATVKDDIPQKKNVLHPKPEESLTLPEEKSPLTNSPLIKIKKRDSWAVKNTYDARIYPRVFSPIELRYQLLKQDSKNSDFLISDGVEYATRTEDISAGGMRFIAKEILPVGSILGVKIQLGEGSKPVECLAKVCRVEEDSLENIYAMVNYYLDLSSADRVAISKFVEKNIKNEEVSLS